tara:strand:- start:748 stop:1326 length:579 start_codon:yes stop_codon:yes gene_type:complete
MKSNDIIITYILMNKLNGFRELSEKIIIFKNELELEQIRKEYIEKDFCNWLDHDIYLRQQLKLNINHIKTYIVDYYKNNIDLLGLVSDDYRRVKSLKDSFNSKWWLTTAKRIKWVDVHYMINSFYSIKIWKLEREMDGNDYENFDEENWKIPTILFISKALNYLEFVDGYNNHIKGNPKFYVMDNDVLFVRI